MLPAPIASRVGAVSSSVRARDCSSGSTEDGPKCTGRRLPDFRSDQHERSTLPVRWADTSHAHWSLLIRHSSHLSMTHLANISHHQDHQDRGRDNEATYDKIIKNDLAWVRCVAALYRCTCQECCAGIHPQILLARCKAPHVHTSKMRARSPSSCALTAPQKCEYMALTAPAAGRHTGRLPGRTQRPP